VQGDFTLSNIVIDADDRAKIIDINRRGCPVGWEPPEVIALIESKQRISMYIGVKSDIFQLGMVLWAIAMEQDEPEAQPRPLMSLRDAPGQIPSYYCDIVSSCLSDDPRRRRHAVELLDIFPGLEDRQLLPKYERRRTPIDVETEYIDPATAVGRDDIENFRALGSRSSDVAGRARSSAAHTYVNAPTDMSGEPYYYPTRGRSPSPRSFHGTDQPPLSRNDSVQRDEADLSHEDPDHRDTSLEHHSEETVLLGHQTKSEASREHKSDVEVRSENDETVTRDERSDAAGLDARHDGAAEAFHGHHDKVRVDAEHNGAALHDDKRGASDLFANHDDDDGVQYISSDKAEACHGNTDADVHDEQKSDADMVYEHKINIGTKKEANKDFKPLVIDVSPSQRQQNQWAERDRESDLTTETTSEEAEKPQHTEAPPQSVPDELAGIGQHSTLLEHAEFPQGVLDDDLTTDMHNDSHIR
jgi:hypothetical protein